MRKVRIFRRIYSSGPRSKSDVLDTAKNNVGIHFMDTARKIGTDWLGSFASPKMNTVLLVAYCLI